ncbi:hypothetical protein [Oceanobacillus sp. FSL H7-0719]|uniref:hypothetical protein n=1 Tax=Oceanobacillus sp. FSL H7-0719 TaxID=2954507 RepID=UPI00324C962B
MKYLMQAIERQEAKQKLPVIRMEIDYELMNLYDAMQAEDKVEMILSKERLTALHKQLTDIMGEDA